MRALKRPANLIIFCLIAILAFWAYDNYQNIGASRAKEKIIEILNIGFNEQTPIALENIGDINWQKICFISYELNGYDASHGLDIPIKYLKIPSKAFSQIADETYTEFIGSEYGMIFWSLKQGIFVAIPLKDAKKIPPSECHDATSLVLLNKMTPEGRMLKFDISTKPD